MNATINLLPNSRGCGRIFWQAILAFEEIGFVWVCFFGPLGGNIVIILCNKDICAHLQSAYGGQDWVCFA